MTKPVRVEDMSDRERQIEILKILRRLDSLLSRLERSPLLGRFL